MTNEEKQTFTLRIANAGKSELTVILCDMFLCYADEAKQELQKFHETGSGAGEEMKTAFRHVKACLREMIASLPMEMEGQEEKELVGRIYSLYRYAEREINAAELRRDEEALDHAIFVVRELNRAYGEVSRREAGPSVMQNTEKIYAGMTYGRGSIQENSSAGSNRGFWA